MRTPPANRRRRGFTLAELLVVMGIIIIIIVLAIPALRAITGNRSVDAAQNQLSAILGQARQDALALQDYRGVLFYIDSANDRVTCAEVRNVILPTSTAQVNLDTTPNRDYVLLPAGTAVQTLTNQTLAQPDRYLGYNPVTSSLPATRYGGVILFDANGRLVSRTYAFVLSTSATTPTLSGMGDLLNFPQGSLTIANQTMPPTSPAPGYIAWSQLGFVTYDREAFQNKGFTDGDPGLDTVDPNVTTTAEQTEETWLDQNATPSVLNRFNGTVIKSE